MKKKVLFSLLLIVISLLAYLGVIYFFLFSSVHGEWKYYLVLFVFTLINCVVVLIAYKLNKKE